MSLRVCALGLVSAGLLSGCLTDPMGWRQAFKDSQLRYTQLVRWGEIDKAAKFVDPELREEFRAQGPAFEKIRITDYEIEEITPGGLEDEATVEVTYHGYSLETLTEKTIREEQEWYRESSNWRVRPQIGVIVKAFAPTNP